MNSEVSGEVLDLHPHAAIRFRQLGRLILQNPAMADWHALRIAVACQIEGREPLRGVLADVFYVGMQAHPLVSASLRSARRVGALTVKMLQTYAQQVRKGHGFPRINLLATRWSVLTSPSLDQSLQALLIGADDARRVAASVLPAILAGDAEAEELFLDHCFQLCDLHAFAVVARGLKAEGYVFPPRWREVLQGLRAMTSRRAS